MASQRGPDWDYYQCKCGNILFEYNVVTGEKFLTSTWKNCTISCMQPVSCVPACARPIFTSTRPVANASAQTDRGPDSNTASTQTFSSSSFCNCCSSAFLAPNEPLIDKSKSSPALSNATEYKVSNTKRPKLTKVGSNSTLIDSKSVPGKEVSEMQDVQCEVDSREINLGKKEDSSQTEILANSVLERGQEQNDECKIKDNQSDGKCPESSHDVKEEAKIRNQIKNPSERVFGKRKSDLQIEKIKDQSPRKTRKSKK